MSSRTVTDVVFAAVLALVALAAGPARAACEGPRVGYPYPIVLTDVHLKGAYRVKSFAALARRDGQWLEIPVQVEEKNSKGDYVLDGGLPFTKDSDDGWLDANDEIVFDGQDVGDDFTDKDVTADVRAGATGLWKLAFCKGTGRVGFVLLRSMRQNPPAWPAGNAVAFDSAAQEVRSSLYRYRFHKPNPVLLGEVSLRQRGLEVPVIRDSTFQMPLRTPFWMPDLTFKAKDFTSSIESWQVGPIRTIVAVGVKYSAFLSLFKLHLFSELVFYRNRFVIPTVVEFIFDPTKFLSPGSGLAYSLRFPKHRSWEIESNLTPLPAKDPVEVVEKGPTAAATEIFHARGHSKDGAFLVQVKVDEKARKNVPPPFLIRAGDFESKEQKSHWPWLGEMAGDLGVFLDFSRIKQGTYNFGLDLLLSPKADETFSDFGPVDTEWSPCCTNP